MHVEFIAVFIREFTKMIRFWLSGFCHVIMNVRDTLLPKHNSQLAIAVAPHMKVFSSVP